MKIDRKMMIDDVKFVIVDVETTGLNCKSDRICQIAFSEVKNFVEINSFSTLINPTVPIPPEITRINGITNKSVKNSPVFSDIINIILNSFYDSVLVGHNIDFDYGFIKAEMERCGYDLPELLRIDTLKLSRKYLKIPNNKLETVARSMNFFSNNWHRADNDVEMTKNIFINFLRMLIKENGILNLEDLLISSS